MKIIRILLSIAAVLLVTGSLSAQTLRYAYSNTNNAQILGMAGDGQGGLVVIEFSIINDYTGRFLWFAPDGQLRLVHYFEQPGENGHVDIVRLTPTELAVRFAPRVGEGEPPRNLLRRFKRRGAHINIIDKDLAQDETMPLVPDNLTDKFGFFTFAGQVRRYSN